MFVSKYDEFVIDSAFSTARDESVSKFMRVVMREQPLDYRVDGVHVGVLDFLKIDRRQHFAQHGSDGNPSGYRVPSHFLFARVAFQLVFIEHTQCL